MLVMYCDEGLTWERYYYLNVFNLVGDIKTKTVVAPEMMYDRPQKPTGGLIH
jgi:hypothetical protein